MATRNDVKIKEGARHVAEGEKCLKTSLFKWKPDYEGAAQAFKDAANSYRVARAHEQAKSAFIRAAEAMVNSGSFFHAAKALEQAALMAKELKHVEEAGQLFERAGQMFRENGSIDTAGLMMDRAGKILESLDPDKAIAMFLAGAELSEDSDKIRQAIESQGKAIQLMVRYRRFDDCIVAMNQQLGHYNTLNNWQQMHKMVLSLVLIHLCREDFVAAQRSFQESCSIEGFADSDAGAVAEDMLNAYDEGDTEKLQEVTGRQAFSFISTEIAKLARALHGPGDLAPPDQRAASAVSAPSGRMSSQSLAANSSSKDRAFVKHTPANLAADRAALLGEEVPKKKSTAAQDFPKAPSTGAKPTSASSFNAVPVNKEDERSELFSDKKKSKEDERAALFSDDKAGNGAELPVEDASSNAAPSASDVGTSATSEPSNSVAVETTEVTEQGKSSVADEGKEKTFEDFEEGDLC